MKPEAIPHVVQETSNRLLGLGVVPTDPRHNLASLLGTEFIRHLHSSCEYETAHERNPQP